MTTNLAAALAAALAETFSAAELEELRETLITAWVVPDTDGSLDDEAPATAGRLLDAVSDAECRAAR